MSNIRVEKYWAEWCQPCKIVAPIVNELKNTYMPKGVQFRDINIDNDSESAQKNRVMSIPTIIIFKDGREFSRHMGINQKKEYENAIKSALNS